MNLNKEIFMAVCIAKRVVAGFGGSMLAFASSNAFASGGSLTPVQTTLQTLVTTLTGPIATSLAILAVIASGFMAWAGRLTWGIAGAIIFGIILVFGSTEIVAFFQSAASGS
jgi:type IV secretion system protein VirB2